MPYPYSYPYFKPSGKENAAIFGGGGVGGALLGAV